MENMNKMNQMETVNPAAQTSAAQADEKKRKFMNADEVADELMISTSHAYRIMRALNHELMDMGYMVVSGRVNRAYFMKKFCFDFDEEVG